MIKEISLHAVYIYMFSISIRNEVIPLYIIIQLDVPAPLKNIYTIKRIDSKIYYLFQLSKNSSKI